MDGIKGEESRRKKETKRHGGQWRRSSRHGGSKEGR